MSNSKSSAARPRRSAEVHDLFLERLEQLEDSVSEALDRPAVSSGPAAAFILDLAKEVWRPLSAVAGADARPGSVVTALATAFASGRTDELGVDDDLAVRVREIVRPLARVWLGLQSVGGSALPARGPVLVTANRSAWPLPVEAVVLWAALADSYAAGRPVYALWSGPAHDWPWVGTFLERIGVFRASAENAAILLERGAVVLAFPEGAAAEARAYDGRYRLARFADRTVVDAALAAGAEIVPAASVGPEESYPLLGTAFGLPLTPTFPVAGAAGLLPLPVSWTLDLGAAVPYVDGDGNVAEADRIADALRGRMQALLAERLAHRSSIVGG